MEDERSGLDLMAVAWSHGDARERQWQRRLATGCPRGCMRERGKREAGSSRGWPLRPGNTIALLA